MLLATAARRVLLAKKQRVLPNVSPVLRVATATAVLSTQTKLVPGLALLAIFVALVLPSLPQMNVGTAICIALKALPKL